MTSNALFQTLWTQWLSLLSFIWPLATDHSSSVIRRAVAYAETDVIRSEKTLQELLASTNGRFLLQLASPSDCNYMMKEVVEAHEFRDDRENCFATSIEKFDSIFEILIQALADLPSEIRQQSTSIDRLSAKRLLFRVYENDEQGRSAAFLIPIFETEQQFLLLRLIRVELTNQAAA